MAGRKALKVYLDLLSQPCRPLVRWHHTNTPPHATKVFNVEVRLAHGTHYALWQVKCSLVPLPPSLCSLDITHNCNKTFVGNVIADVVAGTQCCFVPTDPLKVERALADLGDTLEKLENMFLKRQPFLCGDDISLANLLAVCELMQSSITGGNILKDRPKLLSWKSRVQWGTLDEAHTVLYRLWDRSNAKLR
uniref:GST C-terminal domain-containing protein n=1 Tax=Oncorhynchus kisutch TaxID=8019 RepID=A0A8C7D0S3_ONCKI